MICYIDHSSPPAAAATAPFRIHRFSYFNFPPFFFTFFCSFVIGQAFLSMLCSMKWGVFLFFAGFCVLMTIFIYFLLPETKGVPVERVQFLFAKHPLWRPFLGQAAEDIIQRDANRSASHKSLAASNGSATEVINGKGKGKGRTAPVTVRRVNGTNGSVSSESSYST